MLAAEQPFPSVFLWQRSCSIFREETFSLPCGILHILLFNLREEKSNASTRTAVTRKAAHFFESFEAKSASLSVCPGLREKATSISLSFASKKNLSGRRKRVAGKKSAFGPVEQ